MSIYCRVIYQQSNIYTENHITNITPSHWELWNGGQLKVEEYVRESSIMYVSNINETRGAAVHMKRNLYTLYFTCQSLRTLTDQNCFMSVFEEGLVALLRMGCESSNSQYKYFEMYINQFTFEVIEASLKELFTRCRYYWTVVKLSELPQDSLLVDPIEAVPSSKRHRSGFVQLVDVDRMFPQSSRPINERSFSCLYRTIRYL